MGGNSKVRDYALFTKFRLSFSVIISALSGFLFAGGGTWLEAFYLMIGGFLVTAASNGSNQIWERKLDKMMSRTEKRPLPRGSMSLAEAYSVVVLSLGDRKSTRLNSSHVRISYAVFCLKKKKKKKK